MKKFCETNQGGVGMWQRWLKAARSSTGLLSIWIFFAAASLVVTVDIPVMPKAAEMMAPPSVVEASAAVALMSVVAVGVVFLSALAGEWVLKMLNRLDKREK